MAFFCLVRKRMQKCKDLLCYWAVLGICQICLSLYISCHWAVSLFDGLHNFFQILLESDLNRRLKLSPFAPISNQCLFFICFPFSCSISCLHFFFFNNGAGEEKHVCIPTLNGYQKRKQSWNSILLFYIQFIFCFYNFSISCTKITFIAPIFKNPH